MKCTTKVLVIVFLTLFCFGATNVLAQRVISLNDENADSGLKVVKADIIPQEFFTDAKTSRVFAINPDLQKSDNVKVGDVINLQLFDGISYTAIVNDIYTGLNDNFTLMLMLPEYPMSFGYITTCTNGKSLFFVTIPELNRKFSSKGDIHSQTDYLIEFKDDIDLNLINDEIEIPKAILVNNDGNLQENHTLRRSSNAMNCMPDTNLRDTDPVTLDVLMVYTPAAMNWANANGGGINNVINGALAQSQAVLNNQGNGDKINIVHSALTDYTEFSTTSMNTDLDRLTNPNDGYMDEVHQLRKQYHADLVVLLTVNNATGGLGWLLNNEKGSYNYAFSVVRVQQASSGTSVIHEIGHNMGMNHEKDQYGANPPTTLYPYSWGYYWKNGSTTYGSVMSYTGTGTQFFSNPNATHLGQATGTSNANNAQVFRNTKHVVAFYSDKLHNLPDVPSDIVISTPTNNGATFSWDACANASNYNVCIYLNGSSGVYTRFTTAEPVYTFNNTVFAACTEYYFWIQSVNECNDVVNSQILKFKTRCTTDPTVTTLAATNITSNTVTLNSSVTGAGVTSQGFRYKETTATDWKTSGTGNLTGLSPNTQYHFYAYAITASNTYNGKVLTFTTSLSAAKSVTVGAQSGTMNAGTAGQVTFPVTTANIANGNYSATVDNLPAGVTVSGQVTISNNSGTLTLAGTTNTVAGTTNTLRMTIDNIQSAAFLLVISDAIVNAVVPTISAHPQPATYNQNAAATALTVMSSASDGGTLTYQWYSNIANDNTGGAAISGAIGASYAPPTATVGTRYYYVTVTNTNNGVNGGKTATATSNTAAVTVNAVVNAAVPTISVHPQPATYNQNGAVTALTVTASASDGGTLTYQWYSNTANNNTGGAAINGALGASYAPSAATVGTRYYYVTVTNTNNAVNGVKTATATSSAAAVTVYAVVNAAVPTIIAHPQPATYNQNGAVTALTVTASASDGGTLTYQWYSSTANDNTGGAAINGAIGASYAPPTATVGTRYYYVTVTNTNNAVNGVKTATATSNAAAVTVNAVVNAAVPTISVHPQPATYNQNAAAIALTVTASASDGGTLTYQWYSSTANNNTGGAAINGAIGASYAPPTATVGTRYYYVTVTNTNNGVNGEKTATATSNAAAVTVTVNDIVNAAVPTIIAHPQPATYNQNGAVTALTVTASASDGGTLTYQWYRNTANDNTGGAAINGAIGASYAPSAATVGTRYYYVTVINTNNGVDGEKTAMAISNTAAVTIQAVTNVEIREATPAIIHPNPTNGLFILHFETEDDYVVTISDLAGKILFRQTENTQTVGMDISAYPSGVYLLTIENGERKNVMRIVKD